MEKEKGPKSCKTIKPNFLIWCRIHPFTISEKKFPAKPPSGLSVEPGIQKESGKTGNEGDNFMTRKIVG